MRRSRNNLITKVEKWDGIPVSIMVEWSLDKDFGRYLWTRWRYFISTWKMSRNFVKVFLKFKWNSGETIK